MLVSIVLAAHGIAIFFFFLILVSQPEHASLPRYGHRVIMLNVPVVSFQQCQQSH